MVGLSLTIFGVAIAVVEGVLIRYLIPGLGERRVMLYGFLFNIGIFTVFGLITSGFWALALAPISALGAVVVPTWLGQKWANSD